MIKRAASPMEWVPVAQAVAQALVGPWRPYLIATKPPARLMIRLGMKKGLVRRGPR